MFEKILIEDVINEKLSGNLRANALDFVGFLRQNEMGLDPNGDDGAGWAVGGVVGDSLGFMVINDTDPWTIWFNSCDFDDSISDELEEAVWAHANNCGRCHDGWENCGSGSRIILGKKFEKLCHSPLVFNNPEGKEYEDMKRLLLLAIK